MILRIYVNLSKLYGYISVLSLFLKVIKLKTNNTIMLGEFIGNILLLSQLTRFTNQVISCTPRAL